MKGGEVYYGYILILMYIIGESLSEPHTNQYYEKIAVIYVCMFS